MVFFFLAQKFALLPVKLASQIEKLNIEQLRSLPAKIFDVSSIAELADWLQSLSDSSKT